MITEAQAAKRWCPFARVPDVLPEGNGIAATNRHAGEKTGKDGLPRILRANAMCISVQCMAWRWAEDPDGIPAYRRTPVKNSPDHFDYEPLGFCGLAGRP